MKNFVELFLEEKTKIQNYHSEANKNIKDHSDGFPHSFGSKNTTHFVKASKLSHVHKALSDSGFSHHSDEKTNSDKYRKGHTVVDIAKTSHVNDMHKVEVTTHIKNQKMLH